MPDNSPSPSLPTSHRYRGRFAPSPTGPLHLGSLVAALGSWMMARKAGGEWLVRIEDIDRPREVAGATDMQLETLRAYGMESDFAIVKQSERSELYAAALARLVAAGEAFVCRCSRGDLAEALGIHRACVAKPSGIKSYRLRVPDRVIGFDDLWRGRYAQNLAKEVGDVVLKRADGYWAYQLAVVVDDAEQGITDVVRGADLLDSTPRQIHLQSVLGLPTPRYAHLPLLLDESGKKLGKSNGSAALTSESPRTVLRIALERLGQDPGILPSGGSIAAALVTAVTHFDVNCVPRHDLLEATYPQAGADNVT